MASRAYPDAISRRVPGSGQKNGVLTAVVAVIWVVSKASNQKKNEGHSRVW